MSQTVTLAAPRWRLHLPDPGRGWVRYAPSVWPAAESWIDVPGERWGASGGRVAFPAPPEPAADDVLWAPPVARPLAAERDAWVEARVGEGTQVVTQMFPGERPPKAGLVALDLSEAVLTGRVPATGDLAVGACVALWPMLPGITMESAARARLWANLAESGVPALLVVRPELRPADRRYLASRIADDRYAAVFHGEGGSRRAVAREARRHGLEPFPARPALASAHPLAVNRRVAEVFGLLGELWSRLGMPAERGQAFFSAMRAADRLSRSLARLREEGNLSVLPWLDEPRRQVVEEVLTTGDSQLCRDLLARYAGESRR